MPRFTDRLAFSCSRIWRAFDWPLEIDLDGVDERKPNQTIIRNNIEATNLRGINVKKRSQNWMGISSSRNFAREMLRSANRLGVGFCSFFRMTLPFHGIIKEMARCLENAKRLFSHIVSFRLSSFFNVRLTE